MYHIHEFKVRKLDHELKKTSNYFLPIMVGFFIADLVKPGLKKLKPLFV